MQMTWRQGNRTLSGWELPVLLLLIGMTLVIPHLWYVPLVVTAGLLGVRRLVSGRFLPSTPINLLLLSIVALAAVSAMAFPSTLPSGKLTSLVLGIALFFALTQYTRDNDEGGVHVLIAVLIAGFGMAIFGLFSANWPPPFAFVNSVLDRIIPSALQVPLARVAIGSNELAGVLGWFTPLMVALCIGVGSTVRRQRPSTFWLLLAATGLCSALIIATASRGGILAFAIGIGVILALLVEPRFRLVVAITMGVAMAAIYFTYSNPQLASRMVEDAVGLRGRIEIWERGFETLRDFPLTGVGFNHFRSVAPVAYPLFHTDPTVDIAHSHNQLLQAGLDLGFIGLVAYLATWLLAALMVFQAIAALNKSGQPNDSYRALAAGLAGSLATSWTFGLADAVALGARPGFLWWAILALIASLHHDVMVRKVHRTTRRRSSPRSKSTDVVLNKATAEPETAPPEPERLLAPAPIRQPSSPRAPIPRPHGKRPPLSRPRDDRPLK